MTHPYQDLKEAAERAVNRSEGGMTMRPRDVLSLIADYEHLYLCDGMAGEIYADIADVLGSDVPPMNFANCIRQRLAGEDMSYNRLRDKNRELQDALAKQRADYERMREALERVKMITQDSTYRACVVANDIARAAIKETP